LNCESYYKSFEENHITGDILLECDQVALKHLGIRKVGDRIRINQSLKSLRLQEFAGARKKSLKTLEVLNRDVVSPFRSLSPPSARTEPSPLDGYFSKPISNKTKTTTPLRRGISSPAPPQTIYPKSPVKEGVREILNMDLVKQNNLKFIYPQGQTKTVNIAGCSSGEEIKSRALQKHMSDDAVEPADWVVYLEEDDIVHQLSNNELLSIGQSAQRLERKRLMLCFNGTTPNSIQISKSQRVRLNSHLKLPSLSSNIDATELSIHKAVPTNVAGNNSHNGDNYDDDDEEEEEEEEEDFDTSTLRPTPRNLQHKLSSQRPPSEMISSNLKHYFPAAKTGDLQETIRNSRRFSKRMSRLSRLSHRMSTTSSTWGIPELEESPPPVPALPDHENDDSNTIMLSNWDEKDLVRSKRGSIRESFRKSVILPKRNDTSSVLSALSTRISTMSITKSLVSLGKSRDKDQEEQEEEYIYDGEEDEEDEDDEADKEFLATVQKEESCPSKWIKGRLIGSGSFGTVYLGMNSFTGELMAVKQVELPPADSENEQRKRSMVDALQREMGLLRELHHENIVQYLGSNSEDNYLNIFLEYVPGGSVATLLSNYGVFEESLIRNFVRQILQGLKYLHEQNIIHRDIKGANVLVDNKGCIKISDFGISKKIEAKLLTSNRVSLQGSVFWMAPEVVKQTSYTLKADIWSLGCLVVEMFSGTHPFPEFTQMQAIFRLGNSGTPALPNDCTEDAKDFLSKTFAIDYRERPTAADLLSHPFLTPMTH
jgi:mitogen-activated protein kinase kinase kinase